MTNRGLANQECTDALHAVTELLEQRGATPRQIGAALASALCVHAYEHGVPGAKLANIVLDGMRMLDEPEPS